MKATLVALALVAVASCATQSSAAAAPAGWHAERSGTTSTLYDVGCLSASHCFAVGDAGTLLATTDGRTWHHRASPTGAPLYRIACAPPSSCYAIARPDTIVMTHDAGVHWTERTLPIHVPGLSLAGCVIGDGTSPQGEMPCRLGLLDISCPSTSTCYAVATAASGWDTDPISPGSGAAPGSSLWLTRNSGATWTHQPIPPGVVCNGDCSQPYRYPLEWVSCAPSGPCWAGGNQLIGSHEGFASALLVTSAPGRSWRLEPGCSANNPCSGPPTDLGSCPASTGCYAVNNSNPFGDGSSTIGIYTATGQNGPGVTVPAGLYITDITCPAARTCFTAGAGGKITHTTNGTRFVLVKTPVRAALNGITCVTTAACYAVGAKGAIEAYNTELPPSSTRGLSPVINPDSHPWADVADGGPEAR